MIINIVLCIRFLNNFLCVWFVISCRSCSCRRSGTTIGGSRTTSRGTSGAGRTTSSCGSQVRLFIDLSLVALYSLICVYRAETVRLEQEAERLRKAREENEAAAAAAALKAEAERQRAAAARARREVPAHFVVQRICHSLCVFVGV